MHAPASKDPTEPRTLQGSYSSCRWQSYMETNPRNPISESRPSKRGVVRGGFQYSLLFTVVTLASWLTDELGLCSSSVMVIDVVAIATT